MCDQAAPVSYLVVDIQQHQVVSSGHHKAHSGVVGVHHLVFGSVEDRVVDRQHGRYGQHLLRTLVPGQQQTLQTRRAAPLPA